MQVRVIADRCQGHTLCNIASPDIFLLDPEDGHAVVSEPKVPKTAESAVRNAGLSCPEQAIEVSDNEF